MKYLNKLLVFLFTLSLTVAIWGGVGLAANGPKDITVRTLDVLAMPEYDTPDLLEVHTVTMFNNSDKPFQGELVWQIPKGATNVVVVKDTDVNNTGPSKSLGQVRSGQQYDELYWTPTEAIPAKGQTVWHIEYYNPTAIQGTTDKTFDLTFQQPYEVTLGNISILQPTKASNFKTEPSPQNQQTTQQGIIFSYPVKENQANQAITIKATYTKTDPNPSFGNEQAQGGQGQNPGSQTPAPGPSNQNNKTTLYAIIGLILIIAVAAIVIIIKNDNNKERQEILQKRGGRKRHPDFYDDEEDFEEEFDEDEIAEENEYHEDNDDNENDNVNLEPEALNKGKKHDKNKAKQVLRTKFEKGLITEVDYYEKLASLEDE